MTAVRMSQSRLMRIKSRQQVGTRNYGHCCTSASQDAILYRFIQYRYVNHHRNSRIRPKSSASMIIMIRLVLRTSWARSQAAAINKRKFSFGIIIKVGFEFAILIESSELIGTARHFHTLCRLCPTRLKNMVAHLSFHPYP